MTVPLLGKGFLSHREGMSIDLKYLLVYNNQFAATTKFTCIIMVS